MGNTVDISNQELLLPYPVIASMWKARNHISGLTDNTLVKTGVQGSNDGVTYLRLKDMVTRTKKYRADTGKNPQNIWVKKPSQTAVIKPSDDWKNNTHIKNIMKIIGNFNTFSEFVEKLRSYAKTKKGLYKYYKNSRFIGTQKEVAALTNNSMGNCVDWSQLARAVAVIMGYKVDYVQIQCSNVTHLIIRIIGKEFTKQTYVDLAAIVDWDSKHCPIGNACWCSTNGKPNKIVAVNPGWMNE